jgi:LmbE family N-acetylglucosaminyl deacetylase
MVKMSLMEWIYLSPHFDDAALSCGGLIWEQSQRGERVQVWTICAGTPPPGELSPFAASLHDRWQTGADPVEERRREDREACRVLGASLRHFAIPDCIYRPRQDESCPVCDSEESLFTGFNPQDDRLADELSRQIQAEKDALIISPLGLGGHVDHWLVRTAAERSGCRLLYYPDYPYVLTDQHDPALQGLSAQDFLVSERGLSAWGEAIAAYRSQVSSFWPDLEHMRAAIREYWASTGGGVTISGGATYGNVRLWKSVANRGTL